MILSYVGTEAATAATANVDYDIVYVRWPRRGDDTVVMLPQGEDPFRAEPGADLALLHPDGSQELLVECEDCCVQDPVISFDGEWVYYTKMLDAKNVRSPSHLFKMRIGGDAPDSHEIQLTFDDGFTGRYHKGNDDAADDLGRYLSIRDMGPALLPGGKIAFTSNRGALVPARPGTAFSVTNPWSVTICQIYVMDDHDGSLSTDELSNMRCVGNGNLHLVQHPIVLKDGRLLFSNWDDAGGKFQYAMTTLYAMHPDGSGLVAITEPHDHHKNVDHFATQLEDGAIVTAQYYPSYNFGFGHLVRFPLEISDPAYTRSPSPAKNTYNGYSISYRNYDRKGWVSVTPHTFPDDCLAPHRSGKYCMPAAAPDGALLVAYSTGGVNHNNTCTQGDDQVLHSGIYLIPNAESAYVTDPTNASQLVKVLSSPDYNAIWPRPVVTYSEVHGEIEPKTLPWTSSTTPSDDRLAVGEAHALVGTSSLYNRESSTVGGDPFRPSQGREQHSGTWKIQGTDAGAVKNADIYAVRVVGAVPKPFRKPIDKLEDPIEHKAVVHLLPDSRQDRFVEGFRSVHHERWKILGEVPVRKTDDKGGVLLDPKGDPDTSFLLKIPANTPFFFQGIDKNGMTLFSELTWRAAVPGEARADCGGCHAHSTAPLAFEGTAAGKRLPLHPVGIDAVHPMVQDGIWDLTLGTPILEAVDQGNPPVRVLPPGMVDVEYNRDILPIFRSRCVTCHATADNRSLTDFAVDGRTQSDDPYFRLVKDDDGRYGGPPPGGSYVYPQLSKYVRANQARQSFLVWKLFGQRLDGRQNGDRDDDLDFTPHAKPHGATPEEVRTIARWIDLGCPLDFTSPIHAGYRYTDDNGLPVVSIGTPVRGWNPSFDGVVRVGLADAESGVKWDTLEVLIDDDLSDGVQLIPVFGVVPRTDEASSVAWISLPGVQKDRLYLLGVSVEDNAGNRNREVIRFWISDDPNATPAGAPPPPVTPGLFVRGDANRDGEVSIGDPVAILGYLFYGLRGLSCSDAADTNDDGEVDLSDAINLLSVLYLHEQVLPEPTDKAATDPTQDRLDCKY